MSKWNTAEWFGEPRPPAITQDAAVPLSCEQVPLIHALASGLHGFDLNVERMHALERGSRQRRE